MRRPIFVIDVEIRVGDCVTERAALSVRASSEHDAKRAGFLKFMERRTVSPNSSIHLVSARELKLRRQKAAP